ncbi:actin-like ATPase domain-containing protein [Meredithblackwellia eburnea MCA 4105]
MSRDGGDATVGRSASSGASTPLRPRQRSLTRRPSTTSLDQSTPATARTRPPLPTAGLHTSPAYSTSLRSRHSLYGTEDRIVLDLGSRIWKIGFSGEPAPRECISMLDIVTSQDGQGVSVAPIGLWSLDKGDVGELEWDIREERLKRALREVWFNTLMTDPKTRKVIVVENPLLSTKVKEMITRVLFGNLQVLSISFANSHVLSLMATGTVTGLVIDCGNLETTALSVFAARPLFPLLLSTPVAGNRVTSRLRSLLLQFGVYVPPPPSSSTLLAPTRGKIPREVLTEDLLEEIKTRYCFVGDPLPPANDEILRRASIASNTGARRASVGPEPNAEDAEANEAEDDELLRRLERRYSRNSATTTISFKVPSFPPSSAPVSGTRKGWIQVPGWVRERAAEVLFEEGTDDARNVPDLILESLLKLPIDLRKPLASSILVIGGTAMLPGFFRRLRHDLLARLAASHPVSVSEPLASSSPPTSPTESVFSSLPTSSPTKRSRSGRHKALSDRLSLLRSTPRFAPLVHLADKLVITNDPSLSALSSTESSTRPTPLPPKSGAAPNFAPALLPWIGGSLAGALKTGGEEILREKWEEAVEGAVEGLMEMGDDEAVRDADDEEDGPDRKAFVVPDWTLMRLRVV